MINRRKSAKVHGLCCQGLSGCAPWSGIPLESRKMRAGSRAARPWHANNLQSMVPGVSTIVASVQATGFATGDVASSSSAAIR
jgi:hypothetical protein